MTIISKVPLNELVVDNYYLCRSNNYKSIFKYKGLDKNYVLCDKWYLSQRNDEVFKYNKEYSNFCLITTYNDIEVLYEINFIEIVDYLPNDHIDKIIYLRNKKIKMLLNESTIK